MRSTFLMENQRLEYVQLGLQRFYTKMRFRNESVFTEIFLKRIKGKWRGKYRFRPCGLGQIIDITTSLRLKGVKISALWSLQLLLLCSGLQTDAPDRTALLSRLHYHYNCSLTSRTSTVRLKYCRCKYCNGLIWNSNSNVC